MLHILRCLLDAAVGNAASAAECVARGKRGLEVGEPIAFRLVHASRRRDWGLLRRSHGVRHAGGRRIERGVELCALFAEIEVTTLVRLLGLGEIIKLIEVIKSVLRGSRLR